MPFQISKLFMVSRVRFMCRDSEGNEALIGFVTARAFRLWECDPVDRAQLGLGDRLLDHETVFYILTLAVSPHYRSVPLTNFEDNSTQFCPKTHGRSFCSILSLFSFLRQFLQLH